jgi:hypothetical protein
MFHRFTCMMTASLMMSCTSAAPQPDRTLAPVSRAYMESSFDSMKSLEGRWTKAGEDDHDFYIEFSLTARDTVLVESWFKRGHTHSLTLYHRDGAGLVATHYCPQGNQPSMRLLQAPRDHELSFLFEDATNLDPSTQSYQTALTFEFTKDPNVITRHETYQEQRVPTSSSLQLHRVVSP